MFADLDLLPPDPILGMSKVFREDPRKNKIDLGVGVFRTPDGRTPIMKAVSEAEQIVATTHPSKVYTPPDGVPGFNDHLVTLLLGAGHRALNEGRVASVQAPGGCGALRLAGEILSKNKAAKITIGEPTWANHFPLLSAAGNVIDMVPYYNTKTNAIEFDAFLDAVKQLRRRDVLLLHAGCHNPTGADLSPSQIDQIADLAAEQGFLPLIDSAYHGFAVDLHEDAYMARTFAERLPEVLITYSCSKNFGLYRERTGAFIIVGQDSKSATAVKSHAMSIARSMWSMPPAHGGAIVTEILKSDELTKLWKDELAEMNAAVRENRKLLVSAANEIGLGNRLGFITEQAGMFSMLPLNETEVQAMREDHAIYIVAGGRINMCGVNAANAANLAKAFQQVTSR